ncbi:MAG: PilZ domain-containing protein [Beijerinckiaceae bacterium]
MERRSSPRLRSLLGAKIVFHARQSVISCTVTNCSETGIQIKLPDILNIPEDIEIRFDREAEFLPARIVWRKQGRAGVGYVGLTYAARGSAHAEARAGLLLRAQPLGGLH